MLIGNYLVKVGTGKRVAVPAKLRSELGDRMVIARWYESCLVLVSSKGWEELVKRITGEKGIVTSSIRDTDRFILGSAFEVEPDKQGRVVVPENLKKHAGITSEVIFLGLGDRVELWNKEEWGKRESYIAKNASEMIEQIAKNAT